MELQRQADAYLRKNYPDIAGNKEEINEILTAALDAQHNRELEIKNNLKISSVNQNTSNSEGTSESYNNTVIENISDSGLGTSSSGVNFDIRFENKNVRLLILSLIHISEPTRPY